MAQSDASEGPADPEAVAMMDRLRWPLRLAREPHFDTPVVAFQSDDWCHRCSPATASQDAPAGHAWMLDSIEDVADVQALAGVLRRFRDSSGRAACFTVNCIVAEPDYPWIEASGFRRYRTRPVAPLAALAAGSGAGRAEAVFEPQLHGGEHVSPSHWLALLRAGDAQLRSFFARETMPPPGIISRHRGLGAAYLQRPGEDPESAAAPEARLRHAVTCFATMFGRPASGFVAPNHAWGAALEPALADSGVRYLQASHFHYRTWAEAVSSDWHSHRAGRSAADPRLWYQTRGVDFEPAVQADACGAAISRACLMARRGIPVIVNTHRINYVDGPVPGRGELSRQWLARLLGALLDARPDLRFVGSDELDRVLRDRHAAVKRRRVSGILHLPADLARAAAGRLPA
jgi:hypothetical protein